MKKKLFTSFFILFTGICVFSQTLIDQPVAIVNLHKMEVISLKQFEKNLEPFYRQMTGETTLSKDQKMQILETLVNQKLILQDCIDKDIKVSDEDALKYALYLVSVQLQQAGAIPSGAQLSSKEQLKSVLDQQNVELDRYLEDSRNQLLIQNYVQQTKAEEFKNLAAPTEEEIAQLYQKQISQFARSESVHYSHIFFNTQGLDTPGRNKKKELAEKALNNIISGTATFEAMVRKYSEDEQSKAKNGYAGVIEKAVPQATEQLGKEFIDTLFSLKVGKISNVIESKKGFHIIKVSEKNEAHLLTLDDLISDSSPTTVTVRDYLSRYLTQQQQELLYQKMLDEIINKLRDEAEQIKIFEELLD